MADITSNIDDVSRDIESLIASFDFTSPGKDASLGEDLAGLIAERIIDRSVPDAKAPDGSTWAANEARYAAYKRKKFAADQPGILSGQMLSLESVKGRLTIDPDRLEMTYG